MRDGWRKLEGETSELRLMPALNLASLLVPVAITLLGLAFAAPSAPAPAPSAAAHALEVRITPNGFEIHGADDVLAAHSLGTSVACPAGPCEAPEDWDTDSLSSALHLIKRAWPEERAITVVPSAETPWALIERTTRSVQATHRRGEPVVLFPEVLVGAR